MLYRLPVTPWYVTHKFRLFAVCSGTVISTLAALVAYLSIELHNKPAAIQAREVGQLNLIAHATSLAEYPVLNIPLVVIQEQACRAAAEPDACRLEAREVQQIRVDIRHTFADMKDAYRAQDIRQEEAARMRLGALMHDHEAASDHFYRTHFDPFVKLFKYN
jgi:hypothetical protein